MTGSLVALKRALRPASQASGLIKGDAFPEPAEGLVPGFSASGQDVWLEKAQFSGPGLILSAVGARCGKVFLAHGDWGVVANTTVLIPQPGHDPRFLWWLTNREGFWERGGAAQPYVRVPETLARHVELPPLDEQRAIAGFLDRETARVDALMEAKRRTLGLLDERMRSLISSVFTALGQPEEAQPLPAALAASVRQAGAHPRRLRQLALLGTGHTPDRSVPEFWEDCTIPWVTAADLSGRADPFRPVTDTEQKISLLGLANSAAVLHPPGTVMLCRTASVGLICRIGVPMATTQAFVTWTPGPDLDSRFLMYSLHAMAQEWDRLAYGSTHRTIYMPDLEAVTILHCSRAVQSAIADFLDAETARIAKLIDAQKQSIAMLSERRAALIETVLAGELDGNGRRP